MTDATAREQAREARTRKQAVDALADALIGTTNGMDAITLARHQAKSLDANPAAKARVIRLMSDAELERLRRIEVLDAEDWAAISACLTACASDRREPERYRDWYAEVREKVLALTTPESSNAK